MGFQFKMAGVKALVALAFSGSTGLLFLFLACALPQFNNWIPFTVVIFYLISPIPTLIAKRRGDDSSGSNPCRELAWFLTTGIVVSAFALPIVLSRAPVAVTPAPLPPNKYNTPALTADHHSDRWWSVWPCAHRQQRDVPHHPRLLYRFRL